MSSVLAGWRKATAGTGALRDCSLVVATYRRADRIRMLLARIAELHDVPAEVIVVDGSPDDESQRTISAWASASDLPYELVYVRSPAGLTRQRNVGIDASTGAIVFFLDDDCLPEEGYFEAIRRIFRADRRRVVAAVCGSPVNQMSAPLSRRWRTRLALGIAPSGEAGQYQRMGASMPLELARPFTGSRPVAVMPGCAMSFPRWVLERHRFSSFFHGYSQGEDLEMSLRVAREGIILWCGDARVFHDHAPGGRPASMEKGRMEVRNRFFIWKRYVPDARLADRLRFWSDIAYSVGYDIATFIMRPVSMAPLHHMTGCIRGAVDCLAAPPHHDEPPARREYDFDIRSLAEAAPLPADALG